MEVNILGNQFDLLFLSIGELIAHYLFVFRTVDVAKILGSVFVATINLRNSEYSPQHAVNRIIVVVHDRFASTVRSFSLLFVCDELMKVVNEFFVPWAEACFNCLNVLLVYPRHH